MRVIDRKRRRRAEALFHQLESALFLSDDGCELSPEEQEELATLVRGDADLESRWVALKALRARPSGAAREGYLARHGVAGVRPFRTALGATVFLLPVETFPGHVNNLYLIVDQAVRILVDAGSGTPSSQRDLARALTIVREVYGVSVTLESIDLVVITHAHLDHFGGVGDVRSQSGARIAVHELDARVLANFDERLVVASKDVGVFLRRAGVDEVTQRKLLDLYTAGKRFFRSVEPDRVLRDGDVIGSGIRVHHVPGHCPGLICLQVGNVLLTSDHVLSRITPHQFPQAITPFAGLEHYLRSLGRIRKLEGIDVALGGHEEPMYDLRSRIDEIATFHRVRLAQVLEICAEPCSIAAVSERLFGVREGYGALLAVLEAGAHVEYLHQVGRLRIANLDEVASSDDPVILYEAREG